MQKLRFAKSMKFSGSDVWRSVQTGIQLSTGTVIDMHPVVSARDSKFLLTSHLNPNALEYVFSQRYSSKAPSAVSFRNILCAIFCRCSCRRLKTIPITLIKRHVFWTCLREKFSDCDTLDEHDYVNDDVPNDDADILLANFAVSEIDYIDRKRQKLCVIQFNLVICVNYQIMPTAVSKRRETRGQNLVSSQVDVLLLEL
jgi:hypothetical protein